MPYKLLIEFDISFESPLKRFLKPNEVIRNEPVELTFFVTNLGDEAFPGGMIRNWYIYYGPDRDVVHTSSTKNVSCNKIAPKEKIMLFSEQVVPMAEGLAWIAFSIEPEGEDKAIEYYQTPEDVLEQEQWLNCFYVVNREILLLSSVIEDLITRFQR